MPQVIYYHPHYFRVTITGLVKRFHSKGRNVDDEKGEFDFQDCQCVAAILIFAALRELHHHFH